MKPRAKPPKPKKEVSPDTWDEVKAARVYAGLAGDDTTCPPEQEVTTVQEYRLRYHIGKDTAAAQLRILVEKGLMKSGRKLLWTGVRWQMMRVYWPVGGKHADEPARGVGRPTPKRGGRHPRRLLRNRGASAEDD
jgi:hypothetical protein